MGLRTTGHLGGIGTRGKSVAVSKTPNLEIQKLEINPFEKYKKLKKQNCISIFLAVQDSSIGDIRDQCRAVVDTCDLSEIDQKDEKT